MQTILEYLKKKSKKKYNAFVILKPEFLDYEDEWKKYLDLNDWKIVNQEKSTMSKDQASELYKNMENEPFYNELCEYMSSGDCICATCYKNYTNPIADMKSLKDNIRKQWGINEMKNAMHSSDSIDNVIRESKIITIKIIPILT